MAPRLTHTAENAVSTWPAMRTAQRHTDAPAQHETPTITGRTGHGADHTTWRDEDATWDATHSAE